MSKRSAADDRTEGQAYAKVSGKAARRDDAIIDEMGEFEDAWEDEIESEEEAVDADADADADADGGADGTRTQAYVFHKL
ncbi:hypothetical protein EDD17DRAFT_1657123 [Pisolithus thermaeus]|nr:hypothetical protein EDD17DRAFT_1657123 [Pisolithus thermaeus]